MKKEKTAKEQAIEMAINLFQTAKIPKKEEIMGEAIKFIGDLSEAGVETLKLLLNSGDVIAKAINIGFKELNKFFDDSNAVQNEINKTPIKQQEEEKNEKNK